MEALGCLANIEYLVYFTLKDFKFCDTPSLKAMPPQQRNAMANNNNNNNNSDSEEEETSGQHGGMRRVVSNAEISVAAANESIASSRDYKIRKSSLIQ